ncbi:hypothetical protein FRAHR75_140066 [Frankia sp. Hr75.2]|nr:hypothetical protein FRAHR75_140066 [Frankia sp. Hr75.2]
MWQGNPSTCRLLTECRRRRAGGGADGRFRAAIRRWARSTVAVPGFLVSRRIAATALICKLVIHVPSAAIRPVRTSPPRGHIPGRARRGDASSTRRPAIPACGADPSATSCPSRRRSP